MLMALGPYFFSATTAAYETKDGTATYRWEEQAVIGQAPLYHFMGSGEQTLQLEGAVYADYHDGLEQIPRMKEAADKGEPLMLVDGLGNVLGQWVILTLQEKQTFFRSNGLPRKSTFALNLKKYDDRKNNILWGFLK